MQPQPPESHPLLAASTSDIQGIAEREVQNQAELQRFLNEQHDLMQAHHNLCYGLGPLTADQLILIDRAKATDWHPAEPFSLEWLTDEPMPFIPGPVTPIERDDAEMAIWWGENVAGLTLVILNRRL